MARTENMSIIIPTLNRVESLKDTLDYIMKSTVYPAEIIIVDQSTVYEDCKKIKEYIKQINERTNKQFIKYYHRSPGSTMARNFAQSKAENEILVFMDDDVRIQENTLHNIADIFKDGSISMIAGLNLNAAEERSKLGYLFGRKSYKRRNQGYVTSAVYGRLPQKTKQRAETEWAMGYFFAIKKSLAQRWGIYWEERFLSYAFSEDLDFSYRYYKKSAENGLACIVDPGVAVYHMVSEEWRETSKAVTYMYIINREYLTYKWRSSFWSRIMTRWSNFGLFAERMIKRDRCMDVLKAQFYCDLYRRDIRNGNLHTELYMKV